jgi:hypothetical protein
MATEQYPCWRELFQKTGKRLPPEMRKAIKQQSAWQTQRVGFIVCMLNWLGADTRPELVTDVTQRLDATLDFTVFVARQFLLGNYSPENHWSDVYDQFQLRYLAMDRFIIVSDDSDLSKRTSCSSQAARIMSFEEFLGTLD